MTIDVSLHFLWFDFWVGWFYDRAKRTLYVNPLPMCVIKIRFIFPECEKCKGAGNIRVGPYMPPNYNKTLPVSPRTVRTCDECGGTGKPKR